MAHFAEIREGDELPPLVKGPVTRQMLVEWCAAENDYYNLHYDERVAEKMKLPGTPIQGTFRYAMMGQMVQRWLGSEGTFKRITAAYKGLNLEGETITAHGKVLRCEPQSQRPQSQGGQVELEVWIENEKGERSTIGQATVIISG